MRFQRISYLAVQVFCMIFLAGCDYINNCQSIKFDGLRDANRMRITTNHDKTLRETTSPEEIASLLRFVSARSDNWCQPWFGSPIGSVKAQLYKDQKFLGSISLGPNFVSAGSWLSRKMSTAERQELLRIFGVADPNRQ
jgi:hypothetical protein